MKLQIVSMGELLVEVMREKIDEPLGVKGTFVGPFASGAPAIFIDAVARLGLSSGFIGSVGRDDFGKLIVNRLKEDGVDTTYVQFLDNHTTGVAFVTYYSDGTRRFIYHIPQAASGIVSGEQIDRDYLSGISYLHIMGSTLSINDSWRRLCCRAVAIVKGSGGKISFDPNLRPELLAIEKIREICEPILSSCEIILPSGDEVRMLTGIEDTDRACKRLLECGPEIVALKLGEEGSCIYTKEEKLKVSSFRVNEIDPTGAGDCFDAAFIAGLLKGWPIKRVAKFANAVGALAVAKKGPMEGAPYLREVEKMIGLGQATRIVSRISKKKEKGEAIL